MDQADAEPARLPLPAPATTAGQRRWSLAAAIVSVTVFGLSIGQGAPLLSLLLESRGTDATVNGVNAAAAFIGVLVGPLLAPRGVRLLGMRNFLLLAFALEAAFTPLFKLFDSFGAWFVLRAVSGLCGSSIFTASEAWINTLAGEQSRGRVLGLYAAALSAGFGIGPLLLTFTGIAGWPPFLLNAAIIVVAALPLLRTGNVTRALGRERAAHPFAMVRRAPLIVVSVALFGLFEATMMALLPIWGVRLGLSVKPAAALLAAVYIGSMVLQPAIGWLSDKTARLRMLRLCAAAGLVGAAGIALVGAPAAWLYAALAVWGGIAAALYAVALSMAGDRFRGSELVTMNAAIIIAYGSGALVGPGLGGAAMDLMGPSGLFAFFAVLFCGLIVGTFVLPPARDT